MERGYSADKDKLLKRVSRIEGQVRGVGKMIEDDRYCIDVLTQMSAIRAALDRISISLVSEHAHTCVAQASGDDQLAMIDEMMAAVGRLVKS